MASSSPATSPSHPLAFIGASEKGAWWPSDGSLASAPGTRLPCALLACRSEQGTVRSWSLWYWRFSFTSSTCTWLPQRGPEPLEPSARLLAADLAPLLALVFALHRPRGSCPGSCCGDRHDGEVLHPTIGCEALEPFYPPGQGGLHQILVRLSQVGSRARTTSAKRFSSTKSRSPTSHDPLQGMFCTSVDLVFLAM